VNARAAGLGRPFSLSVERALRYEVASMLRRCALLLAAASAVFARPASAGIGGYDDAWESGYDPGKQKLRSDFTAGMGLGIGFGSASGYPLEVAKMNDPRYLADTGFSGGNAFSAWLGVAFRDWLVFGVGFHPYTIQSSACPFLVGENSTLPGDCAASFGASFMLHVEAYPFFYQSPALEKLGVFTEMGAGPRTIKKGIKEGSEVRQATIADGGAMAFLSLGVVYEAIRLGHFAMGPYIQGSHEFSETLRADQIVLGFRAVYYGGP
jgi:hypothetical protein